RAKDGLNWYCYASNNTTVLVDPSGLYTVNPGTIGYGNGQDWCAVGEALIQLWRCTHNMVNEAENEAKSAIRDGRLGRLTRSEREWAQDAMRHCTGSCKMLVHC